MNEIKKYWLKSTGVQKKVALNFALNLVPLQEVKRATEEQTAGQDQQASSGRVEKDGKGLEEEQRLDVEQDSEGVELLSNFAVSQDDDQVFTTPDTNFQVRLICRKYKHYTPPPPLPSTSNFNLTWITTDEKARNRLKM